MHIIMFFEFYSLLTNFTENVLKLFYAPLGERRAYCLAVVCRSAHYIFFAAVARIEIKFGIPIYHKNV